MRRGSAASISRPTRTTSFPALGDQEKTDLYEGFLSLNPSSSWKIDAGKKTFKWGKGYAWNPVAFIDRPKDPDDPEVGMEGFFALSADYTKSFDGPLKTVSFTPVLQPVYDHINAEFGKKDYLNLAGKLYLLLYDTDIDLIFLTGGSRTTRYGADFSRNMGTNWEIHGEIAYIKDVQAKTGRPGRQGLGGGIRRHEFSSGYAIPDRPGYDLYSGILPERHGVFRGRRLRISSASSTTPIRPIRRPATPPPSRRPRSSPRATTAGPIRCGITSISGSPRRSPSTFSISPRRSRPS